MAGNTQTLTYLIQFLAQAKGVKETQIDADRLSKSLNKVGLDAGKMGRIIGTEVVSSLDKQNKLSQKAVVSFNNMSGGITKASFDLSNMAKVTRVASTSTLPLIENLTRLAERAVLTIPLWLALRGVILGGITIFTDGAKSIMDLDEALKNAQLEVQGQLSGGGLSSFMDELRESATALSKETGEGPEKIVEAFRKFATAGIDAKTSLAGMNTAVKGATATMGDSVEIATLLADVYNQMGDTITEVSGAQNKFNFIMGTIATLMPTNTFTVQEFSEALKNFVGTAKAANLTLDQTFVLVASSATAMQRGARGGTQLASAFGQLSKNTKEIRDFLGKSDISNLSQFEIFFEVLSKASKDINSGGAETNNILKQIEELFGNRGGRDVKALAANLGQFVGELDRLSKLSPADRQLELIERFGTATEKIVLQLNRTKQIANDLVRTFITSATGTTDFIEALKKINEELERMKPLAETVGQAINLIGKTANTAVNIASFGQFDITGVKKGSALDKIEKQDANVSGLFATKAKTRDNERLIKILEERNKQNIELIAQGKTPIGRIQDLGRITVTKPKSGPEFTKTLEFEDRLALMERLKTLGFNELEIERERLKLLTDEDEIYKKRIDILKLINREVIEASERLRSSFEDGLSDLLAGESSFEEFGKRIGDTFRKGFIDALSGSITDQIFKATGIGEIFGSTIFNIRHMGDGIGGPIKSGFDYGGDIAYKSIVRGFKDGANAAANPDVATLSDARSLLSGGGGGFIPGGLGGVTLPGFGSGGFFNRPLGSPKNGPLTQAQASSVTRGQALGVGLGALGMGFSSFQSAGGSQGSLGIPAGITGALGGLGMGLSSLGFGMGAGASGLAAAIGPLLGPIGLALGVGSLLFSGFSKTKQNTVDEKTQEKQLTSRIDVTNSKLDLVNRNLIALRATMETFILPDSAYFAEKRVTLEDQFSVDSRRG